MIRGAVWRVDWADRRPPFGIIVSNNLLNSDSTWPGVLVVPLLLKEPRDSPAKVHIPAGQAGMTQARWALCSAVSFIAKQQLQPPRLGCVSDDIFKQIQDALAWTLL